MEQVSFGLLLFSDFSNHSASCYNVCVKGKKNPLKKQTSEFRKVEYGCTGDVQLSW